MNKKPRAREPDGAVTASHLLDVRAGRLSLAPMNAIPPATYLEQNPRRGAWHSTAEPPPIFSFTTELLLPDGETTSGVWTGAAWWGHRAELNPVGWRWVDNAGLAYRPEPKTT